MKTRLLLMLSAALLASTTAFTVTTTPTSLHRLAKPPVTPRAGLPSAAVTTVAPGPLWLAVPRATVAAGVAMARRSFGTVAATVGLTSQGLVYVSLAVAFVAAVVRKRQARAEEEAAAAAAPDAGTFIDFFGVAASAALEGTAAVAGAGLQAIGEIDLTAPAPTEAEAEAEEAAPTKGGLKFRFASGKVKPTKRAKADAALIAEVRESYNQLKKSPTAWDYLSQSSQERLLNEARA